MKNIALMLASVAVLGLAVGTILADVAPDPYPRPQKSQSMYGTIAKAADEKGSLEVMPKDEKNGKTARKFTTNEKTAVTVDGKEAKVADLKEGMTVKITYFNFSLASKIEASNPTAKG